MTRAGAGGFRFWALQLQLQPRECARNPLALPAAASKLVERCGGTGLLLMHVALCWLGGGVCERVVAL